MKTHRSVRTFLVRGAVLAALSAVPTFAISNEELAKLRAQAETGNGIAQYNLGLQYASISEPFADPIEAYVWLNLAADNGATGRALLLLNSQLTPEQISEGKRRLQQRRAELAARKSGAPSPVSAASTPPASSAANPIAAAPASSGGLIAPAGAGEDAAALQAELKKMSSELSSAWKENEALKADLSKAGRSASELEQLKRERNELSANLANATKEISVLRAATANIEGERNALQEKLAAAEKLAQGNGGDELTALKTKLQTTEAELRQATAAAKDLENAKQIIGSLGQRIDSLTAENQRLSSLAAKAGASDEGRTAAEKELATVRSELQAAQAQLAEASSKASSAGDAQKQLEDVQLKLESALRSYDLQQKEVDRLQKALANIDGEREALAKQLEEAKSAPAKPDAQTLQHVAQLTSDLDAARKSLAQVDTLQRQLAEAQDATKAAQDDLARVSQERDSLSKQLAAAVAAPAKPDAKTLQQVAQLTSDLDAARKSLAQVDTLQRQLAEAQGATKAAQDDLARVSQERDSLSKQLAAAVAAPAKPDAKTLQQVAQLTSDLDAARKSLAQVETLQRELADSQAKLKAAQDEAAHAKSERNGLTKELALAKAAGTGPSSDVSRLNAELKDARDRLTAADQALGRLRDERDRAVREATQGAQQQLTQASKELEDARRQAAAAQAAAEQANQERDALRQQLAQASAPAQPSVPEAQVTELRSQLTAAQEALAAANDEKTGLSQKLAALEAQGAATAAPAPAPADSEGQTELKAQLEQTQAKLDAALRTYTLQQEEVDKLQKALANIDDERAQLADRLAAETAKVSEASTQAAAHQDAAAELASVREQLRQAQNQIASLASENSQLKNRVALAGPPPASTLAAPTRPGTTAAQALARPTPPPAAATEARVHTVVDGDTLSRIAKRYYGSGSRWNEILEANRDVIRDPNNLSVGTKLRIP